MCCINDFHYEQHTAALMHNSAHVNTTGTCAGWHLAINVKCWTKESQSLWNQQYNGYWLWICLFFGWTWRGRTWRAHLTPDPSSGPRSWLFPGSLVSLSQHKAHPLFLLHPVSDAKHALLDLLREHPEQLLGHYTLIFLIYFN